VIAGAQSNDEQMSLTAINGSPEGITAGVSMRKAQKASDPSGAPLNSGFEQIAGVIAGSTELGELSLNYSWIPSLGRDIGKSNSFFPERRQSSYPEELHSVAQLELRSAGSWLLRGYHHYQDWDADVERLGQRRNLTNYRSHTVGGLFMVSSAYFGGEGSAGLEWLGRRGVVIEDEEFDSAGELQFEQQLVDGDEDTLSLFVDQRWVHDALTLSAGLRLDGNRQSEGAREETDTQWSSSLALAYALSETWSVDAEVASGYRFPALSERFFNGVTPRGDTLGNPVLKPETRQNFEVDLRYEPPGSAFSVEASAYYSDLGDYIERYSVDSDTVSYRNLDEASIHGLEFDIQFRAGAIDHRLSYQWQRGEDDDGNTLADLNPPGWRYFLNWRGENHCVSSDLSYRASRERFGAEEMPLDSAWIWNAQFTQALSSAWQGELYVSNILDESYRATADDTAPFQPGRIVGLRLLWKPS
jgi:iron complex outermembrane receptor protein